MAAHLGPPPRCRRQRCTNSHYGWTYESDPVTFVKDITWTALAPRTTRLVARSSAFSPLLQDIVGTQVNASSVDEATVAVSLMTALFGVVRNAAVVEVWPEWIEAMVA